MMPDALQIIGLLYYIACGIGLAMALLIYESASSQRDGNPMHPGAIRGACIVGLFWPLTLPLFGVMATVIILQVQRRVGKGETP